MHVLHKVTCRTALYSIYWSQSEPHKSWEQSASDGGDIRPLVAQQKKVHKLIYKGMWTTSIPVSKKVTERNVYSVYSLHILKHQNNITVYKLYLKWWKEAFASPWYKDDVSNPPSADTVKITSHNAKACYMDSFFFSLHFQRVITLLFPCHSAWCLCAWYLCLL